MDKNIDLKEYFESDLPFYKIKDEKFPNSHTASSTKIIGISAYSP